MDELAGTQTPLRRLTDPGEAIAELERAVPGLAALRLPEPGGIDWSVPETELGTALPPDYKLLCERYQGFVLGDLLYVGGPVPGREGSWARGVREELEIVAEWCEDADLATPLHPYPAPGGLLPWAGSDQGDILLWSTASADPREWTVTVASRSSVWWHYTGGAVQFLADLAGGALEPWGLPPVRPEATGRGAPPG